jgi:hypothetical protein
MSRLRSQVARSAAEVVSVGQWQCPACYTPLEVRDVTPCLNCGGWPEAVARFLQAAQFTEFRLPCGRAIALCRACELEEFMVAGGWGFRLCPGERLPVNVLQRVRALPTPQLRRDKFRPACNLRLAFVMGIADN